MSQNRLEFKSYVDLQDSFLREAATSAIYHEYVYLFFGRSNMQPCNSVLEFDLQNKETHKIVPSLSPCSRYDHSGCVVDDYYYVYGGISASNEILSDLWRFDFETEKWEEIKYQGRIGALCMHEMAECSDTEILILGGHRGYIKEERICFILNTLTNKITEFAEESVEPEAIVGHTLSYVDGAVYVIGGEYVQNASQDIWKFQNKKFSVLTVNEQSVMRSFHQAAVVANSIVVFGGRNGPGQKQLLYDFSVFNTESKNWMLLDNEYEESKPQRRERFCMQAYKTTNQKYRIFIAGGASFEDLEEDVYIIELGENFRDDSEGLVQTQTFSKVEVQQSEASEKVSKNELQEELELNNSRILENVDTLIENNEKVEDLEQEVEEIPVVRESVKEEIYAIEESVDSMKSLLEQEYDEKISELSQEFELLQERTLAFDGNVEADRLEESITSQEQKNIQMTVDLTEKYEALEQEEDNIKQSFRVEIDALQNQVEVKIGDLSRKVNLIVQNQASIEERLAKLESRPNLTKSVAFKEEHSPIRCSVIEGDALEFDDLNAEKSEEELLEECNFDTFKIGLADGEVISFVKATEQEVYAVSKLNIYKVSKNRELEQIEASVEEITAFDVNSRTFAIGTSRGSVLFDEKIIKVFIEHSIASLHIQDNKIFVGSDDGCIAVIENDNFEIFSQLGESAGTRPAITAINSTSSLLLVGDQAGEIREYDIQSKTYVKTLYKHEAPVSSICTENDIVASGSTDGIIRLISKDCGKETIQMHSTKACNEVQLFGNVAVSCGDDGYIRIFKLGNDLRTLSSLNFKKSVRAFAMLKNEMLVNIDGKVVNLLFK